MIKTVSRLICVIVLTFVMFSPIAAYAEERPFPRSLYIEGSLSMYAEPDFDSEVIGRLSPQTVTILEETSAGWRLIVTDTGNYWIFIHKPERYHIDCIFDTYTEPNFSSEKSGTFAPQTVTILERADGDWALIVTHNGNCWVNLNDDINLLRHNLDDIVKGYRNGVSVYYKNIESGYNYSHNDNRHYYSASVIKAPHALYLYDLADKGELDLNKTHTYTQENYRGGSGIIKNMKYGTSLSVSELLEYSIIYSDNIAFRMLLAEYGIDGFKNFISEAGGNTDSLGRLTNANITLTDIALYANLIHNYIQSHGTNNEKLKHDLLHSTVAYIASDYPMANKYGLWDKAMHDMAIVYSESPYILIIMTDKGVATDGGATARKDAYAIFRNISEKVQELNTIFEYSE